MQPVLFEFLWLTQVISLLLQGIYPFAVTEAGS